MPRSMSYSAVALAYIPLCFAASSNQFLGIFDSEEKNRATEGGSDIARRAWSALYSLE